MSVQALISIASMMAAQAPSIHTTTEGNVHVSLNEGASFSVDCPDSGGSNPIAPVEPAFGSPKWFSITGVVTPPPEVNVDDTFSSIKKPVAPGSDITIYGTGLNLLYPVMNYAETGDFECRFTFADGTPTKASQARIEFSISDGSYAIKCEVPSTNLALYSTRSAAVSLWYYESAAGAVIEMDFIGSTTEVTEVPAIVYEVAPATGQFATGHAAPFVTGVGFLDNVGYACVWNTDGASSTSSAIFVDSLTLRCGRPDASIAMLLDENPDLRVSIKVVLESNGNTLINGDHPEHEFKYSSGACGDGHMNGGELGIDCGQEACGTFCEAGIVNAPEGGLCDQDSDCAPFGSTPATCFDDGSSKKTCIFAFNDCAEAKDQIGEDGFYPIFGMRDGKLFNVYCVDGWAVVARVTAADCQAHWNKREVGMPENGFTHEHENTAKFADTDINAYIARSPSDEKHSFMMHYDGCDENGRTMYCSTKCIFDAEESVPNNKDCYDCSDTDGGDVDTKKNYGTPNTGTRGMGHHHSHSNKYFAWQRHPENGKQCGMRSDRCSGSHNGWLMIR